MKFLVVALVVGLSIAFMALAPAWITIGIILLIILGAVQSD